MYNNLKKIFQIVKIPQTMCFLCGRCVNGCTICPLLQMDVVLAAEKLKIIKLEMSQKLMEVSG